MPAVEISDETLERVMRAAHTDSPQAAVEQALNEFAKAHEQASLIKHLGTFDDIISLEDLKQMREMD